MLDFQNFPGEHAPGPPSRTKISVLCGVPTFLYSTWNPLKIWPGSAPDLENILSGNNITSSYFLIDSVKSVEVPIELSYQMTAIVTYVC